MKTVVINICGMKSERCLEGNHSMKWLYQKKTKGLKKKKINNVRFCFKNQKKSKLKPKQKKGNKEQGSIKYRSG